MASCAAAQSAPAERQKLGPCRVPGLEEEVLCGSLEVLEDRGAAAGRKIVLKVVVLPATGTPVEPDAVTFLAGGGVVPASRFASFLARSLPSLREHRDVLLVDQRGTGGSNSLGCSIPDELRRKAHVDPEPYLAGLAACRDALQARADLKLYGTPQAVADLDAVRAWLGYARLDLFAVSYGTRVAQVYLRTFPDRVRSVVLHGPVPMDLPMWQELAPNADRSIDQVLTACTAQPECRATFPGLRTDLATALSRVAKGPTTAHLGGPDGPTAEVDDRMLRDVLYGALGSSRGMADFPHLVHAAAIGHWLPIVKIASERPPEDSGPPKGVFLSILCSESMPRVDPAAGRKAAAGTLLGEWPLDWQARQCALWPRATLPASFWEPVRSDVPALVLVGELDGTTPVRYGEHVVKGLSRGRLVTAPWRAHHDADPCVTSLVQAFLLAGKADGLDTACLAATKGLNFRVAALPPQGR